MSQLTYGRGYTNMAAALRVARTEIFHSQADRPYAQNIMIFITDGKVTIEEDELPREAFKAQMMDIRQVFFSLMAYFHEWENYFILIIIYFIIHINKIKYIYRMNA